MIESGMPYKIPVHPDIVYLLYQPSDSDEDEARKKSAGYEYKNYMKHSAASYINAHLRRYLLEIKRPRGFDYTASCGTSFWGGEIESLPDIHIYSSIPLNDIGNAKVIVHDLQPIIDLCPVNVFRENGIYIPGLKAAAILYHSVNSDQSRSFVLSDVDIIYYKVRYGIDPKSIYMCGLEFNPLLSFLNFSKGIEVFSHLGQRKLDDIEEYKKHEKNLKIPMECQLFNNGVMHIPHIQTKAFFDMYYTYLQDLEKCDENLLQWPWPFWTAEMFATNYAISRLAVMENTILRRFDPDVVDLVHDIHSQFQIYIEGILDL